MDYTVIGRRWFDKVNGNTYHSTRVYKNGEEIGYSGMQYGYGNQWEYTGLEIIKKDDPSIEANALWKLKEQGHTIVTTVSDGLKREL